MTRHVVCRKPQGGYFATTGKVKLRASGISLCPGQALLAYTQLSFRAPPWRSGHRKCSHLNCTTRRRGFRCRGQRLRNGETAPSIFAPHPAQRVSCMLGKATLSWWHVVGGN